MKHRPSTLLAMHILIATSNPHKQVEIQQVISDPMITFMTLRDLGRTIAEPVEDQPTFEGNAALKARYYAKATGMVCLADDSGLEVDALGGDPGVRSARYSGVEGPREVVDPANNRLLLERLSDTPAERRTARFVCAMALVGFGDDPIVVRGTVEGRILTQGEVADPARPERGRGTNGFGYDPLFLIAARNRTTAELSPDDKNAISHRGNAARLMWNLMRNGRGTFGTRD